ncbi:MAG: type I-F CRISPR-associated protein Csy1 [Xanthomonadaceae bacterium]|nr:type I-F CRISPR-associated protein Csy1 [Xanthomonadaceae bacterium]
MNDMTGDRRSAFYSAIQRFLQERRDAKLEKLTPDDPKRDELIAQFIPETWLDDAARRVSQIQAVTHSLKAIHPDARGTNLYKPPDQLPVRDEIGSHSLGPDFAGDVVGNAAALDVYKFLRVTVDGRSLLDWMLAGDADLKAAMSPKPALAEGWIEAFLGLVQPRGAAATHTRAKQLFWLTGSNAADDADYHLLAPLYASSLAQTVYLSLQESRFSEAAKTARQARREQRPHDSGYADYPDLAIQKLGGTKPQNISQLNSERRGDNYLLASLPPHWKAEPVKAPFGIESVFPRFAQRKLVRQSVRALKRFLERDPDPTMETRNRVEGSLAEIIDDLVIFAAELYQALEPGWSADHRCELTEDEQLWLDPDRADADEVFAARWQRMDWPEQIGKRFGNWLNGALEGKLPVGSIEHRHWAKELLLDAQWAGELHEHRARLDAPQFIPTRGAS